MEIEKRPPRENVVRILLSDSEVEAVRSAAKTAGIPTATWARMVIIASAMAAASTD